MVNVDGDGRLVLPKKVREVLGVQGPIRLAVDVCEHFAKLTVPATGVLGKKPERQRSVHKGPLPEGWDSGDAVLQMRESRMCR